LPGNRRRYTLRAAPYSASENIIRQRWADEFDALARLRRSFLPPARVVNIAVAPALGWLAPAWRTRFFQPHTAPTMIATRLFANQLDTGAIQRVDHPGQGFDHAANRTHACFHPLDRWQRNAGQLGQHVL